MQSIKNKVGYMANLNYSFKFSTNQKSNLVTTLLFIRTILKNKRLIFAQNLRTN